MDKIDLVVEMVDKLSGPAKRMTGQMDKLTTKVRGLKSVTGSFEAVGSGAVSASHSFDRMGIVASSAAVAIGELAKDALVGITRLGAGMLKAAGDAVVFRDSTLRGLTMITGSAFKAGAAFDEAMNLSDRIGTGPQKTIENIQALMAKGFSLEGATDVFKGMSDLKVAVPTANLDTALLAIQQIKSKGVLQMEELQQQLAESGLNVGDVLDAIGKRIGKSAQDVRKMISAGEISGDLGISGILDSITKLTGKPLGKASEEASHGIGGLLERFKQLPERFNTEVASKMQAGGAGNLLGDLFKDVGPDSELFKMATDAAAKGMQMLGEGVKAALPLVKTFFSSFGKGFAGSGAIESLKGAWDGFLKKMQDPAFQKTIASWGERIGAVMGLFGKLIALVLGLIPPFLQLADVVEMPFDLIRAAASWLIGQAAEWGPKIIQGLVDGILWGVNKVKAAANAVANAVTGAFDSVFDFGSPSKVTTELGEFVGKGFEQGIRDSMPSESALRIDVPKPELPRLGAIEPPTIGRALVPSPVPPEIARPVVPSPLAPAMPSLPAPLAATPKLDDVMASSPMFSMQEPGKLMAPDLDFAAFGTLESAIDRLTAALGGTQGEALGERPMMGPSTSAGTGVDAGAAFAAQQGGGGGGSMTITVGDIIVQGVDGDPKATAQEVKRVTLEELRPAFEELAIESGVA